MLCLFCFLAVVAVIYMVKSPFLRNICERLMKVPKIRLFVIKVVTAYCTTEAWYKLYVVPRIKTIIVRLVAIADNRFFFPDLGKRKLFAAKGFNFLVNHDIEYDLLKKEYNGVYLLREMEGASKCVDFVRDKIVMCDDSGVLKSRNISFNSILNTI